MNIAEVATGVAKTGVKKAKDFLNLFQGGQIITGDNAIKDSKEYWGTQVLWNKSDDISSLIQLSKIWQVHRASLSKDGGELLPKRAMDLVSYIGNSTSGAIGSVKGLVGYSDKDINLEATNDFEDLFNVPASGAVKEVLDLFGGSIFFDWYKFQRWNGSDPPDMQVNLKFYAQHDALFEVVIPIFLLQMLALPKRFGKAGSQVGLLEPPGKSTFHLFQGILKDLSDTITQIGNENKDKIIELPIGDPIRVQEMTAKVKKVVDSSKNIISSFVNIVRSSFGADANPPDRTVTLKFGQFFELKNLVLKNVSTTWDMGSLNRAHLPMSATAQCTFKAQEVLTRDDIQGTLYGLVEKYMVGLPKLPEKPKISTSPNMEKKPEGKIASSAIDIDETFKGLDASKINPTTASRNR